MDGRRLSSGIRKTFNVDIYFILFFPSAVAVLAFLLRFLSIYSSTSNDFKWLSAVVVFVDVSPQTVACSIFLPLPLSRSPSRMTWILNFIHYTTAETYRAEDLYEENDVVPRARVFRAHSMRIRLLHVKLKPLHNNEIKLYGCMNVWSNQAKISCILYSISVSVFAFAVCAPSHTMQCPCNTSMCRCVYAVSRYKCLEFSDVIQWKRFLRRNPLN